MNINSRYLNILFLHYATGINQPIVGPRIALKLAKNMLTQSYKRDLQETLEVEALCQVACFQTEDQKEGADAFLEKRRPKFRGR